MEKLSCCLLIYYYLYVVSLYITYTMLFTINSVVKRCLKKINSEITLKYFRLLPLLNMKFALKFLAGAGVLKSEPDLKLLEFAQLTVPMAATL